jgi:hypothetical protein
MKTIFNRGEAERAVEGSTNWPKWIIYMSGAPWVKSPCKLTHANKKGRGKERVSETSFLQWLCSLTRNINQQTGN